MFLMASLQKFKAVNWSSKAKLNAPICAHSVCITGHDIKSHYFCQYCTVVVIQSSAYQRGKMWTCCWEVWVTKGLQRGFTVKVLAWAFSGWYPNSSREPYNCYLTTVTKKTKHSLQEWGFEGRSLLKYCNQVSRGENKAFNEVLEREEGAFETLRDTQVSAGTETEEKRTAKPNSKDALRSTSTGSSAFHAQSAHSHGRSLALVCVRGSLDTAPKKKHTHGSRLQILCPLPSALSLPCSTIKVCLRLWGNFAGYI